MILQAYPQFATSVGEKMALNHPIGKEPIAIFYSCLSLSSTLTMAWRPIFILYLD